MIGRVLIFGVAVGAVLLRPGAFPEESASTGADAFVSTGTAEQQGFREAVRRLRTPEFERRVIARRRMQQRHYAEVLYEMALGDAPGAMLTTLRSRAQLKLQLPDNTLYVSIPVEQPPAPRSGLPGSTGSPSPPMSIPLPEDRTFPVDPWSRR